MIFGGSGRDRLQGGPGGDILYGENGGDTLLGGPGGNILNGGPRTDRCLSGDTYVSCELPSVDKILAQCPTKREIARIDAEFDLTFDADPTEGSYACGPAGGSAYLTPLQKRAYNTVRIMGRISFDAALPWDHGHTLGDWFALAITGIRFRDDIDNSFCCDPAGVINLKVDIGAVETDLWIRYPYDAGLAHLMLLMVHEARHNNGYPHTCTWVDGDRLHRRQQHRPTRRLGGAVLPGSVAGRPHFAGVPRRPGRAPVLLPGHPPCRSSGHDQPRLLLRLLGAGTGKKPLVGP